MKSHHYLYTPGYIGIYDCDLEYAASLTGALLSRKIFSCEIIQFTDPLKIQEFIKEKKLELLLIRSEAFTEDFLSERIGKIILLEEEIPDQDWITGMRQKEVGVLFKYQSVTELIQKIKSEWSADEEEHTELSCSYLQGEKKIIGVFSPINRCLKTSFAVAAAQVLGESQSTLFLSFEIFSALTSLLEEDPSMIQGDLSDVIYDYQQEELEGKGNLYVRNCHNFDYIPPSRCPDDMKGLSVEDAKGLISYLTSHTHYRCYVIDFGNALSSMEEILLSCQVIYMPVREDAVSLKKLDQYQNYLLKNRKELAERIQKINPPYQHVFFKKEEGIKEGSYFRQLTGGAFYDYVRQML